MANQVPNLKQNLGRLGLFLRRERKLTFAIFIYALVVGLFSLIIPFTVQELVNTFAFAVTPIMVITLIGIMAGTLFFAGAFRVLQFYATDLVERRLFVRLTLALAKLLPRFQLKSFQPHIINQYFEAVFLKRAFSSIFVDLINFFVGAAIGMLLLVMYHPYFFIFDVILIVSIVIIAILGKGGLRDTLKMSDAKYAAFNWFQNVAKNLIHLKATDCSPIIEQHADLLATSYVQARKSRFRALLRQYIGTITFQVVIHTGLLGTAGWLLSQGELTLGQLVAAEVIVASLLLSLESVLKRSYVIFYFFTALHELDHLFSIPQDPPENGSEISIPQPDEVGIHIQCNKLERTLGVGQASESIPFEATSGEKWSIICPTESIRHRIALTLAGLDAFSQAVVRYNGIDVRSLATGQVCRHRGIVLGGDLTLFEGTILDNITLRRTGIKPEDLVWALEITELESQLDELPDGLETMILGESKDLSASLRLRILLARAIITRPSLLILDGGMHELQSQIRKPLMQRLCSPDCTWTLIIVTTDPNIKTLTQKHLSLTESTI